MADAYVGLSPDSTGKKVDTSEITVGANTVERQRISISDDTAAAAHAAVQNTDQIGTEFGLIVRPIDNDILITGTMSATDAVVAAPAGDGALRNGASTAGSYVYAGPANIGRLIGGQCSWTLQLTGTFGGGTVYIEGSLDSTNGVDGNWTAVLARQIGVVSGTTVYAATAASVYVGNMAGFKYVRTRIVGATSPSVVATWRISRGAGPTPSLGTTTIQGLQPAYTTGSLTTATSVVGPVAGTGMNVATVAWYGTFTGVSCVVEASVDNSNWFTIQGSRSDNGLLLNGLTLASTGFVSADFPLGGWTYLRVRATAWASGTCSVVIAPQTFAYDPCPAAVAQGPVAQGSAVGTAAPVLVGGSDGTNARMIAATAKGTQGAYGIGTQDLKDAGRTAVVLSAASIASVTVIALVTMQKYVAGTVTTGVTEYVVTAGKTLRIQKILLVPRPTTPSATVTFGSLTVALRRSTTTLATGSSLVFQATAQMVTNMPSPPIEIVIPDGLEFAGADHIGFTQVASAATITFDVILVGFEY